MAATSGNAKQFPHLSLPLVIQDRARLTGGAPSSEREAQNKQNRVGHSTNLRNSANRAVESWGQRTAERAQLNLPQLPAHIPLFVQVEPDSDLEYLRNIFNLEIVSEQADGFIVVASEEIDMATFHKKVENFGQAKRGGETAAKIFDIIGPENQNIRLDRLLSESLRSRWHALTDEQVCIVEVGIECLGSIVLPATPEQRDGESDAHFAERLNAWHVLQREAQNKWDDLMEIREGELMSFVRAYAGEVLTIVHGGSGFVSLPDSFTVRIRISGKGLRDLVLNYPYIFEVLEPEQVAEINSRPEKVAASTYTLEIEPPNANAPSICIIDSGIQEQHPLLAGMVDQANSICFVPGDSATDVADYVAPNGHGTRVAGAVIYPRGAPVSGAFKAPCWIQNARVLDKNNGLSSELNPALYLKTIVETYHLAGLHTKLFNHSVAAYRPCRAQNISAWAATMDWLSWEYDVLFFQSAGNLPDSSNAVPFRLGILDHLNAGRDYPSYLLRASSRIPSPSESLQALTVGSINHCGFGSGTFSSFGGAEDTSPYSATGLGVWGAVKPDVVEYGGGMVRDGTTPPLLTTPVAVCTDLIRSTLHGGPLAAKDEIGTSYAAPKVASIAVALQTIFPNESALLYRSLIVNSARWPTWAENSLNKLDALRQIGYGVPDLDRATKNNPFKITLITSGENKVKAKEAHIYQIPIPPELRSPGEDFEIRIDVSLSYVAKPRRTRRFVNKYLSTWVDWRSSKFGESIDSFKNFILRNGNRELAENGQVIPWKIREQDAWGEVIGARRENSTIQKDWAVIKSHELPTDFCIAVRGHPGWDPDPDAFAKYALSVSFEAINQDIPIYERIEASVEALVNASEVRTEVRV